MMVKIRLSGRPDRVRELQAMLGGVLNLAKVSREYPQEEGAEIAIYSEVLDPEQTGPFTEAVVMGYCDTWRTRAEVSRQFGLSYEQAIEILDRLYDRGDLDRIVMDRSYYYKDVEKIYRQLRGELEQVLDQITARKHDEIIQEEFEETAHRLTKASYALVEKIVQELYDSGRIGPSDREGWLRIYPKVSA